MNAATEPKIVVEDLGVSFHGEAILKNVNLRIPANRVTAIIGPSGCGKSTLLRTFNRLLEFQDGARISGRVAIDGQDIYRDRASIFDLRRRVGLLAQRPCVLPMSIFENVAYGPRIHGLAHGRALRELVEHHLREASLWDEVKDRLNQPASRLSIGQQQRLCLARGLAIDPEIILGDEPTSALDPRSAERIERKFLQLKDTYTIVMVTHILRQARRIADYIVFLYFGEVIEAGDAKTFFENPRHPITQAYLAGGFIEAEQTTAGA